MYSERKKIVNSEPPRFDLMMKSIKNEDNKKKYRGSSGMDHYHKTDLFKSRMITEKPEQRAVSTLKACGPVPMCNTSALKQNFLHGDKAAVMYCDKKESIPSTYQNRYKGLQIYKDHARIVDDYRITLAGTTAPDPQVLSKCFFFFVIVCRGDWTPICWFQPRLEKHHRNGGNSQKEHPEPGPDDEYR